MFSSILVIYSLGFFSKKNGSPVRIRREACRSETKATSQKESCPIAKDRNCKKKTERKLKTGVFKFTDQAFFMILAAYFRHSDKKNGSPVRIRHRRCAGAKRRQPPTKNHYGTTSAGKKKKPLKQRWKFYFRKLLQRLFLNDSGACFFTNPEKRQKNGSPVRIRTSTK